MKSYYFILITLLIAACSNVNFNNEEWPDGSLKQIVKKKETWSLDKTKLLKTEYTIQYYKEGTIDSTAFYQIEEYYDNGKLSLREHYHNGEKHGKSESWYEDGQKAQEVNYINGIRHGRYISWFPDGSVLEDFEYTINE
jgi:antitoxin component YwqK of YwqJK toxin-antitoxin module